jgi:hypothetical protein
MREKWKLSDFRAPAVLCTTVVSSSYKVASSIYQPSWRMFSIRLFFAVAFFATAYSFSSIPRAQRKPFGSNSKHFASPRPATDADGYGPVGSLIRQGPVPFFIRIVNPSTYDAAVEKYMALEK